MLELNILRFLALVGINSRNFHSSALKYFIVQRIGSSILLIGVSLRALREGIALFQRVLGGGLFLKLGAAPLHG